MVEVWSWGTHHQIAVGIGFAFGALDIGRQDTLDIVQGIEARIALFYLARGRRSRRVAKRGGVGEGTVAVLFARAAVVERPIFAVAEEIFIDLAVAVVVLVVANFDLGFGRAA